MNIILNGLRSDSPLIIKTDRCKRHNGWSKMAILPGNVCKTVFFVIQFAGDRHTQTI